MRTFSTKVVVTGLAVAMSVSAFAGNRDRTGQAGAAELMINPWGATNGLFGINTATVKGLEAMKSNIAGLAKSENLEIGVSYTEYLRGTGINIVNGGLAKNLGDFGVIGANIQAMNFGEIQRTTMDNPEGGIGTEKPILFNIELGYAKEFNEYVSAGAAVTMISEQISNASASGLAVEAGIQYTSGKRDNLHFGVTLRNFGTNMTFSGAGFSVNTESSNGLFSQNMQTPQESFQIPTYLNIGLGYDFYLDANRLQGKDDKPKHRLTAVGCFQSNSFNNDYIGLGAEYSFNEMFMLRGAYRYENDINNDALASSFYVGYSAGATVQYQVGKTGPMFAFDYAFRGTKRPDNGVHTFSLRVRLPKGAKLMSE